MKYFNIILIVVILIALGAGAYFLFFQTKPTVSPTTETPITTTIKGETPDVVTVAFYKWYLENAIKNPAFTITNASGATQFVSPTFVTNVQTKTQNNTLYTDPVFLSEDYQNDWATNVSATITRQSGTESVVLVTLGGKQPKTLSVRLVQSDNAWHVDAVSLP